MVAANEVPKVTNLFSAEQKKEQPTLSETERQDLLLEKLDLSGLEAWPQEQAEQAHGLLKEYHDIFSLEKRDMKHTNATDHKIVLKDPDTAPFKEHFCRIPPPQLDEVREHLKLMLDAGVIQPSNSLWCNAVVLVRKKHGSLRFCIDFRKLNSLTVKDSHPLPRICKTLESLAGATHVSTFDMNSGFWQVPMAEESKQYTAFTLGSMGLYECESMPLGLCNAPPIFLWVDIDTGAGVHAAPEEDSYSVDFAINCINRAYPGCTGMYLGVAGHMLAFYGKKMNPRAGLLLDQAVTASKAIANIPTWMGYFATWQVKCISTSEVGEILAGCKRIDKENLRRARYELQQRFLPCK